jgi:hypothetical protein
MASDPLYNHADDDQGADEFDELETLAERGRFWNPRNPDKNHPHRLVLRAVRWEKTKSKYSNDERDVLVGKTKTGETWNIPVDNLDLRPLYSGDRKEWNDELRVFEIVGHWGPVRAGEVFAVEYVGDRTYTNKNHQEVTTGSYRYTRKPPAGPSMPPGDDIPFQPTVM